MVAVKDCERDGGVIASRIARVGGLMAYLCRDDDLVCSSLLAGAVGE